MNSKPNDMILSKLIAILQKIPLFEDLPRKALGQVLSLCTKITIPEGDNLINQGDESNTLYILLYGKLVVKVRDDTLITTIEPVSCIGEMGVFTGEKRSATVQAMKESGVLCLRKWDLEKLLNHEPEIGVRIMAKVIKILSERISADNTKIYEFQNYVLSQDEIPDTKDEDSDFLQKFIDKK